MKSVLFRLLVAVMWLPFLTLCNLNYHPEGLLAVEGEVWIDKNGDGLQGDDEQTMPGVEVHLYDSDGNLIDTAFTQFGTYSFSYSSQITRGSYYVEFVIPEGYEVSAPSGTGSIDPSNGRSVVFELDGTNMKRVSLGLIPKSAIPRKGTITLTPSADSAVTSPFPGENYGDLNNLWIDDDSITYLRFLLDGLPAGYMVESATLTLFQDGTGSAGGQTALVTYPDPTQTWDETGLTWNNRPAYAPGALSAPMQMADYTGTGSADSVNLTDAFRYCQQAYPNQQYFDAVIYYPEPGHSSQGWYSRQSQNPPQLNITYTLP